MALEDFERVRRSARCSSTSPTPSRRGAGCARSRRALIERLEPAREIRIEADGHRPARCSVKGRTWVNSDGKRNMPSRRGLHRPARGERRAARSASTSRQRPPGVDVGGVELEFRDGEVVAARAERGDEYLQRALATDDGARRLGELGHRHELRHRPRRSARSSSTRRSAAPSTSRSAAPIPRPAARTSRRAALGPDLRPAQRRPASPPTARSSRRTGASPEAVGRRRRAVPARGRRPRHARPRSRRRRCRLPA